MKGSVGSPETSQTSITIQYCYNTLFILLQSNRKLLRSGTGFFHSRADQKNTGPPVLPVISPVGVYRLRPLFSSSPSLLFLSELFKAEQNYYFFLTLTRGKSWNETACRLLSFSSKWWWIIAGSWVLRAVQSGPTSPDGRLTGWRKPDGCSAALLFMSAHIV